MASKAKQLKCPVCGKQLPVPLTSGGKKARCGGCENRLLVSEDVSRLTVVDGIKPSQSGTDNDYSISTTAELESEPPIPRLPRKTNKKTTLSPPEKNPWKIVAIGGGAIVVIAILGVSLFVLIGSGGDQSTEIAKAPEESLNQSETPGETQLRPPPAPSSHTTKTTSKDPATAKATQPHAYPQPSPAVASDRPSNSPNPTVRNAVTNLDTAELLQRLAPIPGDEEANVITHCRRLPELSYGIAAIVAKKTDRGGMIKGISDMDSKIKHLVSMKSGLWRDTDRYFDDYAAGVAVLTSVLSSETNAAITSDRLPSVQQHVILTDGLLDAVEKFLETAHPSKSELIQELKLQAELNGVAAVTPLQKICHVHLQICQILVLLIPDGNARGALEVWEKASTKSYPTGVHQLTDLLYCELLLWNSAITG